MAEDSTTVIDVTPSKDLPNPSPASVRRRPAPSTTSTGSPIDIATDTSSTISPEDASPTTSTATSVAAAAAAATARRKAMRNQQLRVIANGTKLAALTFLFGMWILGFFSRGDWPTSTNQHAITLPSRQYDTLRDAMRQSTPFLLAFYSSKCMACRRMRHPFVEAARSLQGVVPCFSVSVMQPGVRELIDEFGVKAVPSVFFVGKDGGRIPYSGRAEADKIVTFVKGKLENGFDEKKKVDVGGSGGGDGNALSVEAGIGGSGEKESRK